MKRLLLVIAATAMLVSAQAAGCRSLIDSSNYTTKNWQAKVNTLNEIYQRELKEYKDNDPKTNQLIYANSQWYFEYAAKELYESTQISPAETAKWRKADFMQKCGGFNKRDRKVLKDLLDAKAEMKRLLTEIIWNPYFVANWRARPNSDKPIFWNIGDFTADTGYPGH